MKLSENQTAQTLSIAAQLRECTAKRDAWFKHVTATMTCWCGAHLNDSIPEWHRKHLECADARPLATLSVSPSQGIPQIPDPAAICRECKSILTLAPHAMTCSQYARTRVIDGVLHEVVDAVPPALRTSDALSACYTCRRGDHAACVGGALGSCDCTCPDALRRRSNEVTPAHTCTGAGSVSCSACEANFAATGHRFVPRGWQDRVGEDKVADRVGLLDDVCRWLAEQGLKVAADILCENRNRFICASDRCVNSTDGERVTTVEHAPDCASYDFDPEKQRGPDKACDCASRSQRGEP